MKRIKVQNLGKIFLLLLIICFLLLTGKQIFESIVRAKRIDPKLVEQYRPSLNVDLVKKAAQLVGKNN